MNDLCRRILPLTPVLFILSLVLSAPVHAQGTVPEAKDDESLLNMHGTAVTVNVLANDLPLGGWVPSTVRIIDLSDPLTSLTRYVEPNQGVWEAKTNGTIVFTPCAGSGTPDASCREALEVDPYPIDYVVQDSSGWSSNSAIVTINYVEKPLSASLAYFTSNRAGGLINFIWVTAIENGVAGFDLFVETAEGMVRINDGLIPSNVIDSVVAQRYRYSAQVNGEVFYLREILTDGSVDTYGPFSLGQAYGQDPMQAAKRVFLPIIISSE